MGRLCFFLVPKFNLGTRKKVELGNRTRARAQLPPPTPTAPTSLTHGSLAA